MSVLTATGKVQINEDARVLLLQWTTSYFLLHQDCHLFQQQFVFNIEINRSINLFQKTWTIIRSGHDSKCLACMRETDADRSWQAGSSGNREPACEFFSDEMYKEDPTQGIPNWLQPFTVNLEDLEKCARTFLWKSELRFGRWRFRSGDKSFQSRRRSQKLFIWTTSENLANIVKNYHGIIGQLYLINELYVEQKKDWRIARVRCNRNIFQKTECERSPDNPKRWRICISCGRWFSKIIRERLWIPRTHSETGLHRKEREAQRRISWRQGRVSTWRNKKWRRNQSGFFVSHRSSERISFVVIILNREV